MSQDEITILIAEVMVWHFRAETERGNPKGFKQAVTLFMPAAEKVYDRLINNGLIAFDNPPPAESSKP